MKRGVKTHQKPNGVIRIISGRWRGRKLPVIDAQGLRPTTDRNKETLFNWLMPYVQNARCLDAFAGSGSLGFEALSRHAQSVTFIEFNKQAANNLHSNSKVLKILSEQAIIICGDAEKVMSSLTQKFDLVFLDPPFHKGLLSKAINRIDQQSLLSEQAVIYIESEGQADYEVPVDWLLLKEKQSTQMLMRLYQKQ